MTCAPEGPQCPSEIPTEPGGITFKLFLIKKELKGYAASHLLKGAGLSLPLDRTRGL